TCLADETAFEVFARLLKILRGVLLIQFANCVVKFLRKERLVGFSFFADFFHALQNIGVIGALLRELAREFVLAAGVAQRALLGILHLVHLLGDVSLFFG